MFSDPRLGKQHQFRLAAKSIPSIQQTHQHENYYRKKLQYYKISIITELVKQRAAVMAVFQESPENMKPYLHR